MMDLTESAPIPQDLKLKPGQASIVSVLRNRALVHPGKRAFTFLADGESEEASITYGELDDYARSVALNLMEHGCQGKKVLMFYPAGLDFIIAFFGCLYAGTIPVPVYPPRKNRSLRRIHAIVSNCGAVSILTTEAITHSLERNFSEDQLLKDLPWHSTEQWAVPCGSAVDFPDPGFEDLAFLQYTSGSTGDPKGVMVSHRNIMFNLRALQLIFHFTKEDVAVHWVPQFHDLGLIFGILETIFSGSFTVLIPPVVFISKPYCLLLAMSRYRATKSGQPDFAFNLCIDKTDDTLRRGLDLSSLRVWFNGAEPVRKSTIDRFAATFSPYGLDPGALATAYGMAESTLILTGSRLSQLPVSIAVSSSELEQNRVVLVKEEEHTREDIRWITGNGKAVMDTMLLIADPETKEILPPDRVGEVWARGSTVTGGYYGQPVLTSEIFGTSPAGRNEPVWLRTGDLGFIYENELFVTGRLKDLVIIHGRNFYPQDIEKTVEESHPSVRKTCAAAFSIEQNGEERLAVVAELRRSFIPPDTGKIMDAVIAAVSREFEIHPARIALIRTGSLPKTSSGKIMRRATRKSLLSGELDIVAERIFEGAENVQSALEEMEIPTLENFLAAWATAHLNHGSPVDPANSLTTYGIDSLRAVELTDDTKNIFGFEWPPYLFFEEISIRQLAEEGKKLMENG